MPGTQQTLSRKGLGVQGPGVKKALLLDTGLQVGWRASSRIEDKVPFPSDLDAPRGRRWPAGGRRRRAGSQGHHCSLRPAPGLCLSHAFCPSLKPQTFSESQCHRRFPISPSPLSSGGLKECMLKSPTPVICPLYPPLPLKSTLKGAPPHNGCPPAPILPSPRGTWAGSCRSTSASSPSWWFCHLPDGNLSREAPLEVSALLRSGHKHV